MDKLRRVTKGSACAMLVFAGRLAPAPRRMTAMCASQVALSAMFPLLLQSILGAVPAQSLASVAALVWALLLGQSLHVADLNRNLPDAHSAKARQGMKRVRRLLRHWRLQSRFITPLLIRAALRYVTDAEVLLVLDSTRCGCWEIFTLGIRLGGRVLLIAWAILPYPWPKGRFTPTVVDLLDQTLLAWPADRAVHLVADRGFPSEPFFRCLDDWWRRLVFGYTIRLRSGDYAHLPAGDAVRVGDRMAAVTPEHWTIQAATYRRGLRTAATSLVLGRADPQPPRHQRGPADQTRRARRAAERIAYIKRKGQDPRNDRVWGLLTTKPTVEAAVQAYAGRFSTEGTYRDLKTWDLERVVGREGNATVLDGLLGVAALAYLVQAVIGAEAGRASDRSVRARQAQWSTTDRLSVFWRGRCVLLDHTVDWLPWLSLTVLDLIERFRAVSNERRPLAAAPAKEAA